MKIIQWVNNDGLKKQQTGSTADYSVDNTAFSEGTSYLVKEHYFIFNRTVDPIKHDHEKRRPRETRGDRSGEQIYGLDKLHR